MNTKRLRRLITASALSLVMVVGGSVIVKALGGAEFSTYPESPKADIQLVSSTVETTEGIQCLPANATDPRLLATAEGSAQTYQIWQMTIDGIPVTQTTTLFGQACGKINDTRTFTDPRSHSIFDGMDLNVAQNLANQYYQEKVSQVGGPAAYSAGLAQFLEEEFSETNIKAIFTTVEVEALDKVGVELPTEYYEVREHRGYEPL